MASGDENWIYILARASQTYMVLAVACVLVPVSAPNASKIAIGACKK